MKVMPIRYVRDMAASERFYGLLGLTVDARQRNGHWMELGAGAGVLALHLTQAADADPAVELSFVAEEPLERLQARLAEAGFESDIVDEAFGRSLRVVDPEGVRLQVNEHDKELYT
jgi:catechol 2,3-dioxygenase-like lactoylglutathione lyase family enzyme